MAPSTTPPDSRSRYGEITPDAALAPWVECFWTMRSLDVRSTPNRVLPDGCSDIIIGLGDVPGPVVVGTMRTAEVYAPEGPVDYFGVRFRPGAALRFLDVPLDELTDRRVPLDDLWSAAARALADAAPGERPPRAAAVLHERLRRRSRLGDAERLVANAVELFRRSRGGAVVRDVATALGIGERRLERAFDLCVGVSPKVLGRVLRFRSVIDHIERGRFGDTGSWTALAFDCGYADQPHLIREFRALAGVTPGQYAAERHGVGFVQYPEAAGT